MAAQVQNGQLSVLTLPSVYGGAVLPPLGIAIIADTPDNVVTGLGGASNVAAAGISVSLVADGQVGAIRPTTSPVPDPGTAAAITGLNPGLNTLLLTIGAGAETNTLPIPSSLGQRLAIVSSVQGAGTRAITAAAAINQTGNTIMTFAQLRDAIILQAVSVGGALKWMVDANDGVALS